uniref:Uncharacterized protein n=2 Tax=Babesia bovis TaxID=5865 RepID=A7APN8_BABBO|eukprot:XP_001612090.1 hypothetical protein [Babesia bovis T2Bo]
MRIGKYCKLNDEVAVFLSRLIISMLMVWRTIIPKLEQNFYLLTKLFEYAALFGVTYQMAILLDIVSVETLHTTYAHCILLYITKWMQRYKFSLLQLFKGKKWNELKQALDSNEYTREQLFLGTVIFTLILLIYPTIWVFYCITLVVYLPVFFMRAVVKCLIQVMTKIPFYYLIYNLIFPSSYKESIYFAHKFCWDKSKKVIEGTEERTTKNSNTIVLKDSHEFEIECPPFSTSTLLQPLIHTIKSCKGYLYFWRVI